MLVRIKAQGRNKMHKTWLIKVEEMPVRLFTLLVGAVRQHYYSQENQTGMIYTYLLFFENVNKILILLHN